MCDKVVTIYSLSRSEWGQADFTLNVTLFLVG